MNGKNFLFYWFLNLLIFTILKVWFFHYEIFSNYGIQQAAFWVLSAIIAIALVRRLGIISYLEAMFVMAVWSLSGMLIDLLITSAAAGLGIFYQTAYWFGFVAMDAAIFVFHKKRHLHVRHLLHEKAHGHAHHDVGHKH
jgi:hypothetical protein